MNVLHVCFLFSVTMPESSPVGHGHVRSGGARTVPRPAFHADHIRTFQQGSVPTQQQQNDDNATRLLMNSPAQKIRSNMKSRVPVLTQVTPDSSNSEDHELSELSPTPELTIGSSTDSVLTADNQTLNSSVLSSGHRTITMTGTIKRGHKSGQSVEVQLQMSQEELNKLNRSFIEDDKKADDCIWGIRKGMHILIFSMCFIPFSFISSLCMSFYVGTIGWYNLYLYLSEERTIWHKIFLCPLLILFFPFLIGLSALGVAFYAAGIQISWYLSSWQRQIRDFEKGFYGWVFSKLGVPQCAPYEIVVLDDHVQAPSGTTTATSQV